MDKFACISYPRSGHQLLINVLLRYFSNELNYLKIEDSQRCHDIFQAGELYYCEYYNHCRQHPCSDVRSNIQKTHDFNLDLECKIEKQIVQVRHPIESIISYYKYIYGESSLGKKHWMKFALEKVDYWKGFVNKWVIDNSSQQLIVVSYSDLVEKSYETFSKILSFISPEKTIKEAYLKKVIESLEISKKNSIDKFIHYDSSFLCTLELPLIELMKAIKIEPLFTEKILKNVCITLDKKLVLATSLSPNNDTIQRAAVDSWKKNGFDVFSFNSVSEINKIKSTYPDIQVLEAEKDAASIFGKPYIFIDDLLCTLKKIKPKTCGICGIINSDIVMSPQSRLKETLLCELRDNNLIYGSRVEVESLDRLEGEFYNNGFDMFFFRVDAVDNMPKSLSCLGVTWWDYWLPLATALAGVKLKKLNYPFGYHVSHQTRWSDEQWKFMGLQIATAIYNMRLQAGSNICKYKELFKLDIMIRSAAYYDLSKKMLNKCEKIYASYFNLETFGKAVLEFLKSESTNIFLNGFKGNTHTKANLLNEINRNAESELKINNINVALRMLLNALKIDPYHPDTLCNLGKAACAKGDIDKSIYYYKLCLEKNPYHAVATYNCGKILLQIGQKRIAEQLYSIHAARFPGDMEIAQALIEL